RGLGGGGGARRDPARLVQGAPLLAGRHGPAPHPDVSGGQAPATARPPPGGVGRRGRRRLTTRSMPLAATGRGSPHVASARGASLPGGLPGWLLRSGRTG